MNDQERIEYFKSEIARLSNEVVSLLDERDELKAQVEQLREQLEYMAQQHRCGCGHPACNRCYDDKQNAIVLEATPAQCLAVHDAEIKSQAVEQVLNHFGNKFRANEKLTVKDVCWMLGEHLNQLRNQAKGE